MPDLDGFVFRNSSDDPSNKPGRPCEMLAQWNSERTFHRAAPQQWLRHYFTGQATVRPTGKKTWQFQLLVARAEACPA